MDAIADLAPRVECSEEETFILECEWDLHVMRHRTVKIYVPKTLAISHFVNEAIQDCVNADEVTVAGETFAPETLRLRFADTLRKGLVEKLIFRQTTTKEAIEKNGPRVYVGWNRALHNDDGRGWWAYPEPVPREEWTMETVVRPFTKKDAITIGSGGWPIEAMHMTPDGPRMYLTVPMQYLFAGWQDA